MTQTSSRKVLVLEAGDDPPIESQIPGMYAHLQQNSITDWGYIVEKTEDAGRATRTGIPWPRGKMIGGSGAIDYLSYVRGLSRDYDHWLYLGNPTWGWSDDVLEKFKRSERITAESYADSDYHGRIGRLLVSKNNETNPMQEIILEAAAEMGYPYLDSHDEKYIGYADGLFLIDNGERRSSGKAFKMERENLHVVKNAHVTKLIFDPDSKRANGVEFLLNGKTEIVKSRSEVVLSAGTIGTAQLLLLSGIGPKKDLEDLSIHCVADLKVGHNLQDHMYTLLFYKVKHLERESPSTPDAFYDYLAHRSGPLTMSLDINLVGYFNTVEHNDIFPNTQLHHLYFPKSSPDMLKKFFENDDYREDVTANAIEANQDYDLFVVAVYLLGPKSVGTIRLNSADPLKAPLIEAKYLTDKEDVEALINNIRFVRKMENTKAYKKNLEFLPLTITECGDMEDTAKYWECYVRNMASTTFHPIGTAKMGPDTDENAVVDARLRVRGGVSGVRIIDASIMPTVVNGNTNAAAIMVGEKGSAFIDEEYYSYA